MNWAIRETTAFVCSGPTRVVAMDLTHPAKQALAFEGSGAAVWNALTGSGEQRLILSEEEIVARVAEQYGATPADVHPDVATFLVELERGRLVEQRESVGTSVTETRNPLSEVPWRKLHHSSASKPSDVGQLRHLEGIELAYALAHHLGQANGIRVLAIKGLVGIWHGLREPRVPADVDVLIHPDDFDKFRFLISAAGWRPRLDKTADYWGQHHSVSLIRDGWPCDIDVHRWFPGFLQDPKVVFEALWDRLIGVPIGRIRVDAADSASSTLIMALHALRSAVKDPRHIDELQTLRAASMDTKQRQNLARLAAATGADVALGGSLVQLGVPQAAVMPDLDPQRVVDWQRVVSGEGNGIGVLYRKLRESSLCEWPAHFRMAVWPAEERIRARYSVPPGRTGVFIVRSQLLAGRAMRTLSSLVLWSNSPKQSVDQLLAAGENGSHSRRWRQVRTSSRRRAPK